jgi:O-antigen ligase
MEARAMLFFVLFSSTVYLLAGIGSEVAMGTFTPWTERYRFCGTIHPNNQGVNCSLIILSGVAAAQTERRWRPAYLGLAGFAFVFLILTGSRTSLASFLLTLAGYLVLVYSGSGKLAFGICGLMTGGLAFAIGFNNSFARIIEHAVLLGRTDQDLEGAMALTGRIPLWQNLIEYAAVRPIQGYGYGSFFTVQHIREISDKQGWPIAECHSVFLEVLMGLGLVGMITYAVIQLLGMARTARYFRATRDARYAFLGGLLLLGVIGGMAESTLLVPTMQTFVQFMTLAYLGFQAAPNAVAHHADHALSASPVPIFSPKTPTADPVRA